MGSRATMGRATSTQVTGATVWLSLHLTPLIKLLLAQATLANQLSISTQQLCSRVDFRDMNIRHDRRTTVWSSALSAQGLVLSFQHPRNGSDSNNLVRSESYPPRTIKLYTVPPATQRYPGLPFTVSAVSNKASHKCRLGAM